MKKFFLLFLVLFAPLFAGEPVAPQKWYVKGGLGINYVKLPSYDLATVTIDSGIYSNISIGHQFQQPIRTEIEFSYRNNKSAEVTILQLKSPLSGNVQIFCGMINVLLDVPFQNIFTFTIGAGTGVHKTNGMLGYRLYHASGIAEDTFDLKNESMAFQGIISSHAYISKSLVFAVEYKYWKNLNFTQCNTVSINVRTDF